MPMMLGWPDVDQATLDLPGTDVATAVDGRVPLDDHDCQRVLARVPAKGWREIFYEPGLLVIAAPEPGDDTWATVGFQLQAGGSWSTIGSLGVRPSWYEND